jgi:hypothetical protein
VPLLGKDVLRNTTLSFDRPGSSRRSQTQNLPHGFARRILSQTCRFRVAFARQQGGGAALSRANRILRQRSARRRINPGCLASHGEGASSGEIESKRSVEKRAAQTDGAALVGVGHVFQRAMQANCPSRKRPGRFAYFYATAWWPSGEREPKPPLSRKNGPVPFSVPLWSLATRSRFARQPRRATVPIRTPSSSRCAAISDTPATSRARCAAASRKRERRGVRVPSACGNLAVRSIFPGVQDTPRGMAGLECVAVQSPPSATAGPGDAVVGLCWDARQILLP